MSHQESIVCPQETFSDPDGSLSTQRPPESLLEANMRPPGVQGAAKHIRRFCLECMGGPGGSSSAEVKVCSGYDCPLWFWRFGKDPRSVKDQSLIDKSAVRLMNKKGAK